MYACTNAVVCVIGINSRTCRYNHRSLNPKKLIEIGFSRLNPKLTLTSTIKMYKLPEVPYTFVSAHHVLASDAHARILRRLVFHFPPQPLHRSF
jgi:hypothetical protein